MALLVEAGFRQVAELQPVVALQVPDDLDALAGERHEAEGHAGLGIADVEHAPQVVLRGQALMAPGTAREVLTARVCGALVPHTLVWETDILPALHPKLTLMELVPCPLTMVEPEGTVQV